MKYEAITHREYRIVGPDGLRTSIFMSLHRLLGLWADDPERLAVAVYAYTWCGWAMAGFEVESSFNEIHYPLVGQERMTQEEGWERVNGSLRGRREDLLRERAKGLLMALEVTSPGFEFERIHGIQIEAAVIDCRKLQVDERLAKLREMEDIHA